MLRLCVVVWVAMLAGCGGSEVKKPTPLPPDTPSASDMFDKGKGPAKKAGPTAN